MLKIKNFLEKRSTFICQISENILKIIKYLPKKERVELIEVEVEFLQSNTDKELSENIKKILDKLRYNNNLFILSLPRQQVASYYIKLPTQNLKEIDKMARFQASKYLPYSINELITGYEIVKIDRSGYSYINLIIVHKNIIERYINIFKEINLKNFIITLSSYGLSNLFNILESKNSSTVLLMDIDETQIELVVVSFNKFIYSRSFKILKEKIEENLIGEINKTINVYLKEIENFQIKEIFVFASNDRNLELIKRVQQKIYIPIRTIFYLEEIKDKPSLKNSKTKVAPKLIYSNKFLNYIKNTQYSFASLIGLTIWHIPESLNLLPDEIKVIRNKRIEYKKRLYLVFFTFITFIIFILGANNNLKNKYNYIRYLKEELNKITEEVKPLEVLEKRINFLENHFYKKSSLLDFFSEIHKIAPLDIKLNSFIYEEDNQIILRGQTKELKDIFKFASELERSLIFNKFNIKVNYATKKKIETEEIIDFEIICSKKR